MNLTHNIYSGIIITLLKLLPHLPGPNELTILVLNSFMKKKYICFYYDLSVWYKTKFGSQNFGYQIWCLFL